MSFYTITIAPDDPKQATATVRVKITDADVRIDEVAMRAGDRGLTAHALQAINLDLLARAVTAPTTPRRTTSAGPKTPPAVRAAKVAPTRKRAASSAAMAAVAKTPAPARPASKQRPAATTAATARKAKAADVSSAGNGTRAPGGNVQKAANDAADAPATGRTYRRAPDDLAGVWRQAGTITAVADHYGVPRHTATSWVRTLQRATASV